MEKIKGSVPYQPTARGSARCLSSPVQISNTGSQTPAPTGAGGRAVPDGLRAMGNRQPGESTPYGQPIRERGRRGKNRTPQRSRHRPVPGELHQAVPLRRPLRVCDLLLDKRMPPTEAVREFEQHADELLQETFDRKWLFGLRRLELLEAEFAERFWP